MQGRLRFHSVVVLALAVATAGCSGGSGATDASTSSPPTTADVTTTAPDPTTIAPSTTSTTTTTSLPAPEPAFLWEDVTETALPGDTTGTWSNKVELADIDGDGDVDLLFADGGDYSSAGDPVRNQAWINDGTAVFSDASASVFGDVADLTRVIKARDVSGDGIVDLVVGNTYQTQSRLLLGTGDGSFDDVTATHLPQVPLTVGDLELGDVDADGDLDMVLAHWGDGHPSLSGGGITQLWLNDGAGIFSDVTGAQMPDVLVEWSWEVEFVDIDNDFDLDVAVSCKGCGGGFLFENDGTGAFTDVSDRMPQYPNNYEYEAMDLDGDGFLDLMTLNDGDGFSNHVFLSDGAGGFVDATSELLPGALRTDDNMVAFVDVDSDGDPDALVGNFGTRDRLLVNDGAGSFTIVVDILSESTGAPLGTAVADLNGDGRIDVVQAQGEVGDMDERVFLGTLVEPDTAPPVIAPPRSIDGAVNVRIHDNKSPLMPHDFTSVVIIGPGGEAPLQWYGEYLWRSSELAAGDYTICAIDAAGNEACSEAFPVG